MLLAEVRMSFDAWRSKRDPATPGALAPRVGRAMPASPTKVELELTPRSSNDAVGDGVALAAVPIGGVSCGVPSGRTELGLSNANRCSSGQKRASAPVVHARAGYKNAKRSGAFAPVI